MQISNKVIEKMNTTVEQVTNILKSIPEPSDQKKLEENNTILHNVSRTVESIAKEAHEELDEKHDQADQLIEQAKNGMVKSQQKIAAMWKDAHENADHDAIKSIADNMLTSIANPETSDTKSDDSEETIDNGVQILDSIGKICHVFSKTPESKDELYVTEHDGFFKALGKILHIMAMPSDLFPDKSEAGQDFKRLFDLFKKFLVASVEAIVLSSNPILFVPAFVKFAKAAADMYNQAVIAEKSQAKQYTQEKVATAQKQAKASIKIPEWKRAETKGILQHAVNYTRNGQTISVSTRDLNRLRDIEKVSPNEYQFKGTSIPVQLSVTHSGLVNVQFDDQEVQFPISQLNEEYPGIFREASDMYKQEIYEKEIADSTELVQKALEEEGKTYVYVDGKMLALNKEDFEKEPDKYVYPQQIVVRAFDNERFSIEQAGKEETYATTRSELAGLEKMPDTLPDALLPAMRERFGISPEEIIATIEAHDYQPEVPERIQEFDRDEQNLGEDR